MQIFFTLRVFAEEEKLQGQSLAPGLEADSFFLWFKSIPGLSAIGVREFSPTGAADVFSNNESEHVAKVHLGDGWYSPVLSGFNWTL